MKEFKPSNLGLNSIKENTGENERLKSFFFNTGKNITIQSFSKFTRILIYLLHETVFCFFLMSGHLAKQVSTMHIESFIECGILKYF